MRPLTLPITILALGLGCSSNSSVTPSTADDGGGDIGVLDDTTTPESCGDGVCTGGETTETCPTDCDDTTPGPSDVTEPPVPADCFDCLGEASDCETVCINKGFGSGFCGAPRSMDPAVCCVCTGSAEPPKDDVTLPPADCTGCLQGAADCLTQCQSEGFSEGYCVAPGSLNPEICCQCNDPNAPPPPTAVCGDGDCEGDENTSNCPADCDVECGPAPHYQVVNGQCLPSCGVLINASGWNDATCCQNGCGDASQNDNVTWDCPTCCPGENSCVDSTPPDPPPTTGCGDGSCAPGEEDCGTCPGDCPCPPGKSCKNNQCVDPGVGTGCELAGEFNEAIEDSVYDSAVYVKSNYPQFFYIEDWDDLARRKQAYKMMTTVLNHLRAKCVNASRCVANPGLPESDPFLWCSDALVIGTPGNGVTVDIYQSWSDPAIPQVLVTEGGGQTGVVTADLIPLP